MADVKLKNTANQTEVKAETQNALADEVVATTKPLEDHEKIELMNVTNGEVIYKGQGGRIWSWGDYGVKNSIPYEELRTMRAQQSTFLTYPWLMPMGDRGQLAIEELGLTDVFSKVLKPEDMERLFNLSQNVFEDRVMSAPKGMQVLIVNMAKRKLAEGTLDSLAKVNFIEKTYKMQLK